MTRVEKIEIDIIDPLGSVVDTHIIDIPKDLFFYQKGKTNTESMKYDRAIIKIGDKKYLMDRYCNIEKLEIAV